MDTSNNGRHGSETTPDGITTTYAYNSAGALERQLSYVLDSTYFEEDNTYYGNTPWLKTHLDKRGTCTYYQRTSGTLWQVDAIKVSDTELFDSEWLALTASKAYTYYTVEDTEVTNNYARVGQLKSETVPDVGGTGQNQVTEYKYYDSVAGKIRLSPTETKYWDASGTPRINYTVYNDLDQVLSTTDGNGKTIWYRYDTRGRQTFTVYKWVSNIVDGTPEVYAENHYDCCTLEYSQDENGHKTYYAYDDANRVIKTWTDITGQSETTPLVEYTYDVFGNQQTVTTRSASGTGMSRDTGYTYNKLNQVTKIVYGLSPIQRTLS